MLFHYRQIALLNKGYKGIGNQMFVFSLYEGLFKRVSLYNIFGSVRPTRASVSCELTSQTFKIFNERRSSATFFYHTMASLRGINIT